MVSTNMTASIGVCANIPVFDSLVHLSPNGQWFDTKHDASLSRLLRNFQDYSQLKKALLVGMPGNDLNYLLKVTAQYPKWLVPIAPFELGHEDHLEQYFNQLKKLGFKGIKIHPRLLKINLLDQRLVEAVQCAGKVGLIILLCTVHKFPSPPMRCPVSEALYDICLQSQNAKIILLHGGYYDLLATSEIIRPFENVLLDLSATLLRFQNAHLKETIAFLFESLDRRLIIGSDFPEHTIQDVIASIEDCILKNRIISVEKLENIFYKNLEAFL